MPAALTDNWLLKLAGGALAGQPRSRYPGVPEHTYLPEDSTSALLHLIDLLIFYDTVFYDEEWSHTWKGLGLANLQDILVPATVPGDMMEIIRSLAPRQFTGSYGNDIDEIGIASVVRNGASFYRGLSDAMGVPYWPSPARAKFLARAAHLRSGPFFTIALMSFLDENLRQIEEEVLEPLSISFPKFRFMGLATVVLANCASRESILETALEVRESREAEALRTWLTGMEEALARGDTYTIARAVKDLHGVIEAARKGLGLEKDSASEVQLQVGLAPTISLGSTAVRRVFSSLTPRPLHISFLRSVTQKSLRNLNSSDLFARLFAMPEKGRQQKPDHGGDNEDV